MARILEVMGRPEILVAILRISREPATQQEVLVAIEEAGLGQTDQGTLSRQLGRLEDLGILAKPGKRAAYTLRFPELTLAVVAATLELSRKATTADADEETDVAALLRRARLRAVDGEVDDRP